QALKGQHGHQWLGELPVIKGVIWGDFRRGLVATATFTSFAELRSGASACRAAAPMEAVSVRWPRQGESAEALGPVAGLRELTVTGTVLDRGDVSRLAEAPLLSTLRALNVRNASLGADGLRRLLASPHLGNLTALRVPFNSLGNGGVRALIDASSL